MKEEQPVRHFIRYVIVSAILMFSVLIKPFRFLHGMLPPKIREIARSWDLAMVWTYVSSYGKRFYMDQRCELKNPESYAPLVNVPERYRFSESEIEQFYRDGFAGPITVFAPEEMVKLRPEIERILTRPSRVYPDTAGDQGAQGRDRHLDSPEVWNIISQSAIVERLAQLLGENLIIWRSQVFLKPPGGPEVTWHQASTYMSESKYRPVVEPPDKTKLFQLTTWFAIDDADVENGCLHFVPGSHHKIRIIRSGGGSFANANFQLEQPIDPSLAVPMQMRSGQCVIFTERVIHGSPPNISDRRRFGMTFRVVPADVQLYRGQMDHNVSYLGQHFSLENWGAVLLRGRDTSGLNKLVHPPVPVQSRVDAAAAG